MIFKDIEKYFLNNKFFLYSKVLPDFEKVKKHWHRPSDNSGTIIFLNDIVTAVDLIQSP